MLGMRANEKECEREILYFQNIYENEQKKKNDGMTSMRLKKKK